MTENEKKLNNEELEEISGGKIQQKALPTTHGNICPRCRSPRHRITRMQGMDEVRICEQCGLEYYYRRW